MVRQMVGYTRCCIATIERLLSSQSRSDTPALHRPENNLVLLIVVGLAYFMLAHLGLRLASINPSATPLWPPTGLAIAAILLCGYRIAPAIFIGAFLINQLTAGSIFTSLSIASGNTLEAVIAGYLVRHWAGGEQVFDTPTGIIRFTLISVGATAVSATVGVSSLTLAGHAEVSSTSSIWLTWWLGDLAGALVVTPVVVLWVKSDPATFTPSQITRAGLTYLATAAVGIITFSPILQQTPLRSALGFLAILPLLWASLRQGPRDTATVVLILSAFAVWGTLLNGGPFAKPNLNDSFILLLGFMVSAAVFSLVLSTDVRVRQRIEKQHRHRDLKTPAGLRASGSQLFDISAEDSINYSRCTLAAVALFALFLEPPNQSYDANLAHTVLIWYFAYSAIVLIIAKIWPTEPVWPFATHLTDIGASAFLMQLTDGTSSPFFIFFTFTLIAATLRWNWRGVMWTTLVVLLMFSALAAGGLDQADIPRIVMRATFLVVLGLLLAYFGALRVQNRERVAKLGTWPTPELTPSTPPLEALLAHAADVMGVSRMLVVWEEPKKPERHFSVWSEGRFEHRTACVEEPVEYSVASCLRDVAFMTRSGRSSAVTTHAGLRLCASPAVAPRFREHFKIKKLVSAPFSRARCHGRVFALDGTRFGDSQLLLIEIVSDRIGIEIEHHFLQQDAEVTVAERERSKLAHDLHDGLLQSLTASTLQLKVCSKKCEGESLRALDSVRELLAAEQRRLRDFVNGRREKTNDENCVLANACESVLTELSKYWRCQTPLRVVPTDARVPSTIAEHIWLILAEAIANAAKHGGASRVLVDLERTTDALSICISDNGSGFRGLAGFYTDQTLINEQVGPRFLCDRVRGLRGHLVLSTSATGSSVQIWLPVPP
jgi:signal transduction histidine kinase/integral membrane sensor domain MASE1